VCVAAVGSSGALMQLAEESVVGGASPGLLRAQTLWRWDAAGALIAGPVDPVGALGQQRRLPLRRNFVLPVSCL